MTECPQERFNIIYENATLLFCGLKAVNVYVPWGKAQAYVMLK